MSRITDRQNALKLIEEIDRNKKDYLVIHYSSESFVGLEGRSPRISSIAIENLEYGQSTLFAIYKTAETLGFKSDEIHNNYEKIENTMLKEYFKFVENNQSKIWLHWNMRDSIFGFKALEHRYKVLGNEPVKVEDSKQNNIAALFKNLYGRDFVDDPKMVNLMEINNLKPKNFLSGKEEADAFENNNFYNLSMSTAGKVRMFTQMVNLAIDNNLKTNVKKIHFYGTSLKAKWLWFKDSWFYGPILFVIGAILSAWISNLVDLGLN